MGAERVAWFGATSGRATGVLGIAAGAAVVIVGILDGSAPGVVAGLLGALLSWLVLLRPRVGTRGPDLVLRGMVSTVVIPLASVESIVVRQVLAIGAGGRTYVSAAVGRTLRDLNRQRRSTVSVEDAPGAQDRYADQVREMITQRSREARRDGAPAGPVRREWAWPEVAGVGVLLVALVVALVV
jgi:hypothetical protein